MLVPMTKVHVIGHRGTLEPVLEALHRTAAVQLIDVTKDASVPLPPLAADEAQMRDIADIRYLKARIDGLLAMCSEPPASTDDGPVDLDRVRADLEESAPKIEALARQLDELEAELATLPRHLQSLKRLVPLLPELTELEGYDTEALVLDARHASALGDLNAALDDLLDGNFEIISGEVDADTVGAVIVTPKRAKAEIQSLLGRQQVNRVRLPHRFEAVPFRDAISAMERRMIELPVEIQTVGDRIETEVRRHPDWPTASARLAERIDQLGALHHLGATTHTFVLSGWVPAPRLEEVRREVARAGGRGAIVELAPIAEDEQPPVLMANRSMARPFESLVSLLSAPRYGSLDPTTLMMIFLPLFFGMMLGDVVYGALLLVIALGVRHKTVVSSPSVAQFSKIFVLAAIWTIIWGVVFGEFLGDLGHRLFGLEPIWINREEALEPLLIFSVALGAAHITLGLVLGVWMARRQHDRKQLGTSAGTLLALVGAMLVVGVSVDRLPAGVMTPAVAAIIVGTVLMIAMEGPMGLLTGPLELIGLAGNVLSYLRIAAIGIASVYLARVANELGSLGPLWFGIIVAGLFHALNLALGVFSPTIQALRLHYVEFFGKFYEGDGTPFRPFGSVERKG
jgi:V/A-type H+-transporting ATPase subunit I